MMGENQEAACRLENTVFQATGHKRKKGANHKWLGPYYYW